MKKITLFFAISFVFSFALLVNIPKSFAQQIVFTVIGAKGTLKADGQPLKIGTKLKDNQTVTVGENSYLSLASTSNKSIEVTQQGSYEVKQLLTKANASQSLPKQYTDFVISELTKANEEGISAKNRFQHMNKSGSVKRGGVVKMDLLDLKSGDDGHFFYGYNESIFLSWYIDPKFEQLISMVDTYEVEIQSEDGTSLFKQKGKEQEMIILLSQIQPEGQNILLCKVTPLNSSGATLDKTKIERVGITRLSDVQRAEISAQVKKLEGETPINKLVIGRFFEQKGLLIDACIAYKQATVLSGNSVEYEDIYYNFLIRNLKQ